MGVQFRRILVDWGETQEGRVAGNVKLLLLIKVQSSLTALDTNGAAGEDWVAFMPLQTALIKF